MDDNVGRHGGNKVVRMIERYGIDGTGEDLERFWTTPEGDRKGLRELADIVNRRILGAAMAEAGVQSTDGEVENIYSVLTDEAASAERTRIDRRLRRDGVDVDTVVDDFVSYGTIRRYLTKVRDAEYPESDGPSTDKALEVIQRLQSRLTRVTESKLDRLSQQEELTLGEGVRTSVDVRVLCPDCGTQRGIDELLRNGGCDCE